VAATAEGGTGEGGAPWAAGLVAFACSGPDDATGGCVASAFEGAVAFEGGVAPELKRSSLLGGWTALVVIISARKSERDRSESGADAGEIGQIAESHLVSSDSKEQRGVAFRVPEPAPNVQGN